MAQSKTAKASMVKEASKEKFVWTPESAIREIRKNRQAKLFVCNMELVDLLLAAYDGNEAALFIAREGQKQSNERLDAVSTEMIEWRRKYHELWDIMQQAASVKLKEEVFGNNGKPVEQLQLATPGSGTPE